MFARRRRSGKRVTVGDGGHKMARRPAELQNQQGLAENVSILWEIQELHGTGSSRLLNFQDVRQDPGLVSCDLKFEQPTATGFEVAGALLSQCCNESLEKPHNFSPERGKLLSVDL